VISCLALGFKVPGVKGVTFVRRKDKRTVVSLDFEFSGDRTEVDDRELTNCSVLDSAIAKLYGYWQRVCKRLQLLGLHRHLFLIFSYYIDI
jgi:hypothetical protein